MMVFETPLQLMFEDEEPLRTDNIFMATCVIRDELQKMEERCMITQAKGEELKQKRDELTEILRLFQTIEENERNTTKDLELELLKMEKAQYASGQPSDSVSFGLASSQTTSTGDSTSVLSRLSTANLLHAQTAPSGAHSSLYGVSTGVSTSNHSGSSVSSAWKEKFASIIRDSRDLSYVTLPSMDGSDGTTSLYKGEESPSNASASKDGSGVLGVVTALKTNVTNSLDKGVKWATKGSANPKYVGGSALKKTMPHKVRRRSRKPFVPVILTKARRSVKRKAVPKGKEIGLPFDARKVSGTSSHLGEPTMEPLKGAEAFHSGLASIGYTLPPSVMTGLVA